MDIKNKEIDEILFSIGKALHDKGNQEEALKFLEFSGSIGNSNAMFLQGKIFYNEFQVDFDKTYIFYTRAAELGNIRAMVGIGDMFRYGYGIEVSKETAVEWYEKAKKESEKNQENCQEKNREELSRGVFKNWDKQEGFFIYEIYANEMYYDKVIYDFIKNTEESPKIKNTIEETIYEFFGFILKQNNILVQQKFFDFILKQNNILVQQNFIKKIYNSIKESNNNQNINNEIDLVKELLNIAINKNNDNIINELIQIKISLVLNDFLKEEDKEKLVNNTLKNDEISNIYTKTGEPILYAILTNHIFIEDLLGTYNSFVEQIVKRNINFGENEFSCSKNNLEIFAQITECLSRRYSINSKNKLYNQFISLANKFNFSKNVKINKKELNELNINYSNFSNILNLLEKKQKSLEEASLLGNLINDFSLEKNKKLEYDHK